MLRAVAVLAAFAGCTCAGWRFAARLKKRRDALSELATALERLSLDMTYTNRPIAALLEGLGERETGRLFCSLSAQIRRGASAADAWETARLRGEIPCVLEEREQRTLTLFFAALGTSDRCAQKRLAETALASVRLQLADAENVYASRGRICRAMGLLLGAGVSILML